MKKWFPLVCLLLLLTACGDNPSTPNASDPNLGFYRCISASMEDAALKPSGEWLELKTGGKMTVFLTTEPDAAEWKLSGTQFSMSMAGKEVGKGTLADGTLSLELMGISYVFVQDGSQAAQEKASDNKTPTESQDSTETLSCYDDLYYITYPTDVFHQNENDLSDLTAADGTKVWLSKLETPERVTEWFTGFDQKSTSEKVSGYESFPFTVGDAPARCIVYLDGTVWVSEVLVDFGANRGTKTAPMYAAYLHFSATTRASVWNDTIQGIVESLHLSH